MLRVVAYRRSSSHAGYSRASSPATRLCSRRKSTLSITKPICEFVVSLPVANSPSKRSGGIWPGRTTLRSANSGLIFPPS